MGHGDSLSRLVMGELCHVLLSEWATKEFNFFFMEKILWRREKKNQLWLFQNQMLTRMVFRSENGWGNFNMKSPFDLLK